MNSKEDISEFTSAFRNGAYKDFVESQIQNLPARLQVAFAASCAIRLVPYYKDFCTSNRQQIMDLFDILDRVWTYTCGHPYVDSVKQSDQTTLESIDFGEVDLEGRNAAIWAVSAVHYSLLACNSESAQYAARCAECVETVIYQHLQRRMLGQEFTLHPNDLQKVLDQISEDPVMIREFLLQSRIIEFLSSRSNFTTAEVQALRDICEETLPTS